jgi:excisionase family DNA binding protein
MLNVKQAAARAGGVSPSTIYELCRAGRLPHYRIGGRGRGRILIDEEALDAFLAACRVEGPPGGGEDEGLKFIRP